MFVWGTFLKACSCSVGRKCTRTYTQVIEVIPKLEVVEATEIC